jgi:chromosome segregation ATPase
LRGSFGILLVVSVLASACSSTERCPEAEGERALRTLERHLGDIKRRKEENAFIEQQLKKVATLQASLNSSLAQVSKRVEELAGAQSQQDDSLKRLLSEFGLLRIKVDILDTAEEDLSRGLQSLARNQQELMRLDDGLKNLASRLESCELSLSAATSKSDLASRQEVEELKEEIKQETQKVDGKRARETGVLLDLLSGFKAELSELKQALSNVTGRLSTLMPQGQ